MKKSKILPMIFKGIITAIVWRIIFYIIVELHPPFIEYGNLFLIIPIFGMLVCGMILLSDSWLRTLISWLISGMISILIFFPLIFGMPQSLFDEFYFRLMFGYLIICTVPTFISTLIVMLVYKFIQKKRMAKKLDEDE